MIVNKILFPFQNYWKVVSIQIFLHQQNEKVVWNLNCRAIENVLHLLIWDIVIIKTSEEILIDYEFLEI